MHNGHCKMTGINPRLQKSGIDQAAVIKRRSGKAWDGNGLQSLMFESTDNGQCVKTNKSQGFTLNTSLCELWHVWIRMQSHCVWIWLHFNHLCSTYSLYTGNPYNMYKTHLRIVNFIVEVKWHTVSRSKINVEMYFLMNGVEYWIEISLYIIRFVSDC
jgi:hypothetical protein